MKPTLVLLGSLGLAALGAAQPSKPHTLERLYSLPRLIGTAPTGFAWSADSQKLAFLWNDEGTNFKDVWTVDVPDGEPVRVTRMPRTEEERDPGVTSVSWHPDGDRMLITFRGDLYFVSPGEEPLRRTSTSAAETAAAISPDGVVIAYLRDGDLWMLSDDRESPYRLTSSEADRSVRSFRFAPDSRQVAFIEADTSRVPERSIPDYLTEEPELVRVKRPYPGDPSPSYRLGHLVTGGAPQFLDLGRDPMDPIFSYRWSPETSKLLVDTSDLYVKDRRILIADVFTGELVERLRERQPLNVSARWQVEWSPRGDSIYLLSDRDEDTHLYRMHVRGSRAPERVTHGDWAVDSFAVFDHGVFVVGNDGRPEERHVFFVDRDTERRRVSSRPGLHRPTYSPNGRYAADYFSSDDTPYDLFLLDLASEAPAPARQLTHSPLAELSDYEWVKPEYVTFESHVDGVTLHGRLTIPPGLDRSRKHPAILGSVYSNTVRNQWGGRTAHPTWGLDQYLVQEGYVLLNVDFRGSSGHGKAFRRGIRLDYGGIDVEDLHSGVKFLETLGFVDMERIGIWGSSYGGLLTCMSLFKKPGVYKAGVAGAPATNVFHALTGEKRVMMEPGDEPDAYERASAFTHAAGLEDALMIIHGMRDRIVLFKDSVVLVDELMRRGKDVDLVALPDAGHGWDNEALYQTRFAFEKLVSHFERHLGKGPTPP